MSEKITVSQTNNSDLYSDILTYLFWVILFLRNKRL